MPDQISCRSFSADKEHIGTAYRSGDDVLKNVQILSIKRSNSCSINHRQEITRERGRAPNVKFDDEIRIVFPKILGSNPASRSICFHLSNNFPSKGEISLLMTACAITIHLQ